MIPDNVRTVLEEHSLEALEFEPGSTPTSEMAAEQIGVEVGQIAKSILMRGKDGVYRMFLLAGDRKISNGKIKRFTGVKHSMTGADETREVTGFLPGSVCPFGVEDIEIYVDVSLKDYPLVYPAAGTDASGVPIRYDRLLAICGGRECDVAADGE
ncbi:MAG: YbaK/EbsC family protein [Spirochaetota bacterium]|nr:YbaK/EbsC family protein [Spirochaetota bacterium]